MRVGASAARWKLDVRCWTLDVGGWRFGVGCWRLDVRAFVGAWIDDRPGLVHFVNPVGLHLVHDAPVPSPPFHFEPHVVGRTSCGKYSHRVIARQIPPPADHLLALHRHRTAVEPDLGADPVCIRGQSFQSHRHPRRAALVAVNSGRTIQIVHHHIQVPVIVQIGQTHPLGDFGRIEPPIHLLEAQPAKIAERQVCRGQSGKQFPQAQLFDGTELPRGFGGFDLAEGVQVHVVTLEAVGDQQILIAVQVHIEKDAGPGPFRGFQPGVLSDFGIGSIAAIQK